MMKTKIALAAMLVSLALTPAEAAQQARKQTTSRGAASKKTGAGKPSGKSKARSSGKKSSTSSKTNSKAKGAKAGKAPAAAAKPLPPERRQDRAFDSQSSQFLLALWRLDPDAAIAVGKFDTAAMLAIPDQAYRDTRVAFIDEWLAKLSAIDARQLSPRQRSDHAMLLNKLNSDRWYLTTFREWEWNPATYNIAAPIDAVLNTEYAARPQRLRTLLRRIAGVPAYYDAARNSIRHPTREHIRLAIDQAPGVLAVLADLERNVGESILNVNEKALFAQRINNARVAVQGYAAWLGELDKSFAASGAARSFRIGKEMYETKFGFDIQSSSSAEQTYQKALAARDTLLANMERLTDELWPKYLADQPKPAERSAKIGMMIDYLSVNHVTRANFFPEIRRQIPLLQEWVESHDLLALDAKTPLVVRETPAYQRGVAGASIEAPGPYRPQDRTYYNVTPLDDLTPEQAESTLREYNYWILQILNMHEAIPGHYAQLVYANRSPSLIKSIFGNDAMVEGWAVYSERMMLESGYGDNTPEMWLMYSKWHLRSVSNTILDYSVHVLGMTREEAIGLLTQQAFQTAQEADEKWRRVQLTSVQLTSYYSGYADIMELREQRRAALGSKFSLKDFHQDLLSHGSAPVRVIRELMQ